MATVVSHEASARPVAGLAMGTLDPIGTQTVVSGFEASVVKAHSTWKVVPGGTVPNVAVASRGTVPCRRVNVGEAMVTATGTGVAIVTRRLRVTDPPGTPVPVATRSTMPLVAVPFRSGATRMFARPLASVVPVDGDTVLPFPGRNVAVYGAPASGWFLVPRIVKVTSPSMPR